MSKCTLGKSKRLIKNAQFKSILDQRKRFYNEALTAYIAGNGLTVKGGVKLRRTALQKCGTQDTLTPSDTVCQLNFYSLRYNLNQPLIQGRLYVHPRLDHQGLDPCPARHLSSL